MFYVSIDGKQVGHPFDRFRAALAYAISILEDRITDTETVIRINNGLGIQVFHCNTETWQK